MPITPLSFKGDSKSKKHSKKRKVDSVFDEGSENRDGSQESYTQSSTTTTTTVISATSTTNPPRADAEDTMNQDSSWVSADQPSDMSGPTVIVLPTRPTPGALACDAVGDVFASPLENIVEEGTFGGEGGMMTTAEPHDVRQVWVVSRIVDAGGKGKKEGEGDRDREVSVSFKGANGRYLGCGGGREAGKLRAEAVAVGAEETFRVARCYGGDSSGGGVSGGEGSGGFLISTVKLRGEEGEESDMCIGVQKEGGKKTGWEVRGQDQATATEETSMLWIRMQARFKPRLKANKEMKAKEKISRRELEAAVGRRLDEDEVKRLKMARKNGSYHEEVLDVRVKGKHDKFAC